MASQMQLDCNDRNQGVKFKPILKVLKLWFEDFLCILLVIVTPVSLTKVILINTHQ